MIRILHKLELLQHLVIISDQHALTGTEFQVLLMNRSLLDDWLYDKVMLQLLGTAGTVNYTLMNYTLVM